MYLPPTAHASLRRTPMFQGQQCERTASPRIASLAFLGSTIRSGGVVVATVRGENLKPDLIGFEAVSPGFVVDVLDDRSQGGPEILLGVRIYRRQGTPRGLCLVRVTIGETSSVASITVRRGG